MNIAAGHPSLGGNVDKPMSEELEFGVRMFEMNYLGIQCRFRVSSASFRLVSQCNHRICHEPFRYHHASFVRFLP